MARVNCVLIEECDKVVRGHLKASDVRDSALNEARFLLARAGQFISCLSRRATTLCNLRWRYRVKDFVINNRSWYSVAMGYILKPRTPGCQNTKI